MLRSAAPEKIEDEFGLAKLRAVIANPNAGLIPLEEVDAMFAEKLDDIYFAMKNDRVTSMS
ncbi:MAG: hypothetical protein LBD25_01755 [Coriobacteriales bacterium]|nr:hypothetical protein [Coriobacteriales bacterium]